MSGDARRHGGERMMVHIAHGPPPANLSLGTEALVFASDGYPYPETTCLTATSIVCAPFVVISLGTTIVQIKELTVPALMPNDMVVIEIKPETDPPT